MSGERRDPQRQQTSRRRNMAAALVAGGAISFLYYNFEPVVAEEKNVRNAGQIAQLTSLTDNLPRQTASLSGTGELSESLLDAIPAEKVTSELSDRYAVLFIISQLQRGIEKLEQRPSYSTVFERQERIDGVLHDPQQIEMKVRHAPFSVYMKWQNGDRGRQLLFAEQENEGRMLVKLGGLKGRLVPTLKLEPTSDRAMSESRYPVTQSGLVNLARQIIHHRQQDLKTGGIPVCRIEEGLMFNGRPCYKVQVEYKDRSHSKTYWKCVTLIDEQLSLPVYVKNQTWPTENMANVEEETMIECYSYTEIQFEDQLADAVWEEGNPEYRFRR